MPCASGAGSAQNTKPGAASADGKPLLLHPQLLHPCLESRHEQAPSPTSSHTLTLRLQPAPPEAWKLHNRGRWGSFRSICRTFAPSSWKPAGIRARLLRPSGRWARVEMEAWGAQVPSPPCSRSPGQDRRFALRCKETLGALYLQVP